MLHPFFLSRRVRDSNRGSLMLQTRVQGCVLRAIKRVICFSNPAYLSLRLNQLVVKLPEVEHAPNLPAIIKEESVRTIPIEDIGVVVLDNKQITILIENGNDLLSQKICPVDEHDLVRW